MDDAALCEFDLEAVLPVRPRALEADVGGGAEHCVARSLSDQSALGVAHPPRPRANAAQGKARALAILSSASVTATAAETSANS